MKNISSNLIVQIVSLVLWAVALMGLEVNPQVVGTDLLNSISTANWPLIIVVVVNLGNSLFSWIRTWKTNRPQFWLFLKSTNWWVSFCNILFAVLAMQGIVLPAEASATIVDLIFRGEWWTLLGFLIPNVLGPIIRFLTKKVPVAAA